MKAKMSFILILLTVAFAVPVLAKPVTFTVPIYQAQFQWRAWAAFGDWSNVYQDYLTSSEYTLTGNVLHSEWEYSPVVTDLEGQSTVYVYDKDTELWIEKEGHVFYKYVPYYGDYWIANFFRGYLNFAGDPTADNFVHGVAYQWVYLMAPEDWEGNPSIPYAQWDEKVGAWLVGFSIYLWDSGTQSYDITVPYEDPAFPDPFIEPVPANDFNPLIL
jgi:hypothetical protein